MKISEDLRNKLRNLINSETENLKRKCVLKIAHSLSDQEVKNIISKFSDSSDSVTVEIDPRLIAGFIFTKGSTQHDYSLRSKIIEQF